MSVTNGTGAVEAEGEPFDKRLRGRVVDDVDGDAGRAQPRDTAAGSRVRIERPDDDAFDARREERLGARSGAAGVIARLERHIGRRAARVEARGEDRAQRFHFGVRLTAAMMIALAQRDAVPDDHRPDRRVGRRVRDRPRREFAGAREVRASRPMA